MVGSPSSSLHGWALGAVLLLLASCDGSSPTAPGGDPQPLPAAFWLTGSADSTESDGTTVSCLLELRFELTGSPRVTPEGLGAGNRNVRSVELTVRG